MRPLATATAFALNRAHTAVCLQATAKCYCWHLLQWPLLRPAIQSAGGSAMTQCARPSARLCAPNPCAPLSARMKCRAAHPHAMCAVQTSNARQTRARSAKLSASRRAAPLPQATALCCARRRRVTGSAANQPTARARAASCSARHQPVRHLQRRRCRLQKVYLFRFSCRFCCYRPSAFDKIKPQVSSSDSQFEASWVYLNTNRE